MTQHEDRLRANDLVMGIGNLRVMMLYGNGQYHVFTSKNLLQWKNENKAVRDSFECPDFFELPIDGDARQPLWVFWGAAGLMAAGVWLHLTERHAHQHEHEALARALDDHAVEAPAPRTARRGVAGGGIDGGDDQRASPARDRAGPTCRWRYRPACRRARSLRLRCPPPA